MKQKNLLLAVVVLFFAGCSLIPETHIEEEVSNPASEHCENNGGTLEIVPDEGGSWGKCNFDDGSFCEERAYFHGECSPGWGDGNTIELEEIQDMQDDETLSEDEKEELSELVEEIQEHEVKDTSGDIENIVQETLEKYKEDGTGLEESSIDLMNEIMDMVTQG